jgi:hypothetical protein
VIVIVAGLGLRLAIGGTGIGARSAVVMSLLLLIATWLAARLLSGPRTALLGVLALSVLLDIGAFPPRNPPPYDDLQAFYRTDQILPAELAVPATGATTLSLLVQPVFSGAHPQFGLAGQIEGSAVQWNCAFAHGIQWLALPVRLTGTGQADVRLNLTGSPSRDGDYLIVYASSQKGGFLISLGSPDPNATLCSAG